MTKPAIFNLDYNASFEMYDESCNNISRYKCPHWQERDDTIFMPQNASLCKTIELVILI